MEEVRVGGMKEQPKKTFMSSVGILTVATVLSKVIGLFFRIPLLGRIGIGGMAYFHAASHIYVTLYLAMAAGLPLAVSILVAERLEKGDSVGVRKVFRMAVLIFCLLGGIGGMFLFFGAERIAGAIALPGASSALRAISPTLLFAAISAAIRGYFQGQKQMRPTAVSEVIESTGKLIFGLLFAEYATRRGWGAEVCAAFAISGITLGALASTLYLVGEKWKEGRREKNGLLLGEYAAERGGTLGRILRIAMPVTVTSLVLSLASVIDTVLIPERLLASGLSLEMAKTAYSSYGNLALPLFNLPSSLITPIALALVPLLSAAYAAGRRGQEAEIISAAMRLTALFAIPASVGLSVLARPILTLLYPREAVAVGIASPLLSILALSVLLSCLMTVTNAMLSTYGHPGRALFAMIIGAGVKLCTAYLLVGNPAVGIYGAPISTFLCNITVVLLTLLFVWRCAPAESEILSVFGRPLLSSAGAVGLSAICYRFLDRGGDFAPWKLLLSLLLAAILYLLLAIWLKAVREEDILLLPKGEKLARLLFRRKAVFLEEMLRK